jgi:alpha-tubulin suppressor-like RCC1 family protein
MPNQFNSPEGDLENYFVSEYWLIDQYVGDTLWGWGVNSTNGRVGNNSPTGSGSISTPVTTSAGGSNWKQISTAFSGSSAIKTDGTLWVWGNNANTQLGGFVGGLTSSVCTPITTFGGGTNWKQCSSGGYSTAAIKTDGTLWVWGAGSSGELGNNVTTSGASNRCTPVTTFVGGTNWKQVSCGTQFMAAVKTDGTLWTWGNNAHGTLGINLLGTASNRCTPVTTFIGGTNWKQVSCGVINIPLQTLGVGILTTTSAAAIKTDGTLWTWGSNSLGQLGINLATAGTNARCTPVTTFIGGTNWKSVSSGGGAMAAIKTDGTLWIWGNNSGNLGDNTILTSLTPVTTFAGGTNWKSVASGISRTSAIKTDGTLWVWGLNGNAQLGTLSNQFVVCTPVTTFIGGSNWKQVSGSLFTSHAITSGTDPTSFVS